MLLSSGGPTGSGGGRCRRFGNCHSFSTDSMRDFRYSKAFMGSFSRKGDATRKPKSRRTDGVSTEGGEPVFRVKIIVKEALLSGKKYRAFLIKFTSFGREVLRNREALSLSGKREGRGAAWRLSRPTDKVGREGIVLRLNNKSFFGVYVPLTHRSSCQRQ